LVVDRPGGPGQHRGDLRGHLHPGSGVGALDCDVHAAEQVAGELGGGLLGGGAPLGLARVGGAGGGQRGGRDGLGGLGGVGGQPGLHHQQQKDEQQRGGDNQFGAAAVTARAAHGGSLRKRVDDLVGLVGHRRGDHGEGGEIGRASCRERE